MSEMVDRAVKAVTDAFEREGRAFDEGQAETLVRAVIVSLREPTAEMWSAEQPLWALGRPMWDWWRDMIDEVLQ